MFCYRFSGSMYGCTYVWIWPVTTDNYLEDRFKMY